MLQRHARAGDKPVHVLNLFNPIENMIFNGFCECHIVRGQNEFHTNKVAPERAEIKVETLEFFYTEWNEKCPPLWRQGLKNQLGTNFVARLDFSEGAREHELHFTAAGFFVEQHGIQQSFALLSSKTQLRGQAGAFE